jgi:hypothetical protein
LAWIAAVACIGIALPMSAHRGWSADLRVEPVSAQARGGVQMANVTLRLNPADAADGAAWFNVLSWQGASSSGPGGSSTTALVRQPDGSYRTASPVPISGAGKTLVRLHTGRSLEALPIYLPADPAIPVTGVDAVDSHRSFVADKRIVQREARADRAGLQRLAYATLGLLATLWIAVLAWGLVRIEAPARRRPPRVRPLKGKVAVRPA